MERFSISKGDSPLVVSFPHSGTLLFKGLYSRLNAHAAVLPDTDWHVPELYNFLDELGASKIYANYSRYVVDLNRDPSGQPLYPGQAGTGVVPFSMFDGKKIYKGGDDPQKPEDDEIEARIEAFHTPYHEALLDLLEDVREKHGYAILWDAHSIKSEVSRLFEGVLPDLNLGTNDGQSCHEDIQKAVSKEMSRHTRFECITNGRFKGGFITRSIGNPDMHIHALQMELAQLNYMDENEPWEFDALLSEPLRIVLKDIMSAALSAAEKLHNGENL
jgi:N-formylglutamate deformylase